MMIDCGLFLGTKRGKEIMTQVAEDVKAASGGKLDSVVLTHEHWDHISGFSLAKDIFDAQDFTFDQVWMGWTENENDPKVKEVRERFIKKKKGLRIALGIEGMEMERSRRNGKRSMRWSIDFFGEDENAALIGMSGRGYLEICSAKKRAEPRYCSTRRDSHARRTATTCGFTFSVRRKISRRLR